MSIFQDNWIILHNIIESCLAHGMSCWICDTFIKNRILVALLFFNVKLCLKMHLLLDPVIMTTGAYRYPDGSEYSGEWNSTGQRHGHGHMFFPDRSEFWGSFQNGLCTGPGIMKFADGSR